jgi:hypothetical protein
MTPYDVGAAADGELICDFCAATGPVVYYEVTEFSIGGAGAEFLSGDRFYASPPCRQFIDASDWKGLRAWIGPEQFGLGHRMLLVGFPAPQGSSRRVPAGHQPRSGPVISVAGDRSRRAG